MINQGRSTNISVFDELDPQRWKNLSGRNFGQRERNRHRKYPATLPTGLPRLLHPVPDEFAQVFPPRRTRNIFRQTRTKLKERGRSSGGEQRPRRFLIKQAAGLKTDRLYITEMRFFFYTVPWRADFLLFSVWGYCD